MAAVPAKPLPFKRLIGRDSIKPIYWLGVIAILLIVFTGITADLAQKDTSAKTSTDAEEKTASVDLLSEIPVFWIMVLILGNLSWRMICEMCAVQFALYSALTTPPNARNPGMETLSEDDSSESWDGGGGVSVQCPHCGKVVPASEQRTCDHCGLEGCSSCIRLMGLVRKKWTCRDCFEKK
jgi:hypothetical protein